MVQHDDAHVMRRSKLAALQFLVKRVNPSSCNICMPRNMPGPLDQNPVEETVVEAIDNDVSSPDTYAQDLHFWQHAKTRILKTHCGIYVMAGHDALPPRIPPTDRIRPNRLISQEKFFVNTSSKECPINSEQSCTLPTLGTVSVSSFSLSFRPKWADMELNDLRELTPPVQHPCFRQHKDVSVVSLHRLDCHGALDNSWIRCSTDDSSKQIDLNDFQEGHFVGNQWISDHISDGRFSSDKPGHKICLTLKALGLESFVSATHRNFSSNYRGRFGQCNIYIPSGKRGSVKCCYCDGGFNYWDYGDDPWIEHAKWCPNFGSHDWQLLCATTTECDATSHQPIQWVRYSCLNRTKMKQPNPSAGDRQQAEILPSEPAEDPDGTKTEEREIYEEGGYIENLAPPTGGEDGENYLANIPGTSGGASSNQALRRPLNLPPAPSPRTQQGRMNVNF